MVAKAAVSYLGIKVCFEVCKPSSCVVVVLYGASAAMSACCNTNTHRHIQLVLLFRLAFAFPEVSCTLPNTDRVVR